MPTSWMFSIRTGEPLCQRTTGARLHPPTSRFTNPFDDDRKCRPLPNGRSHVASNLNAWRTSICENDLSRLGFLRVFAETLLWSLVPTVAEKLDGAANAFV